MTRQLPNLKRWLSGAVVCGAIAVGLTVVGPVAWHLARAQQSNARSAQNNPRDPFARAQQSNARSAQNNPRDPSNGASAYGPAYETTPGPARIGVPTNAQAARSPGQGPGLPPQSASSPVPGGTWAYPVNPDPRYAYQQNAYPPAAPAARYGSNMGLNMPTNRQPAISPAEHNLLVALKGISAGEDREPLLLELKALLDAVFKERMSAQRAALDAVQARLDEARAKLDLREKSQDQIVGRRLNELLDKEDPLQWDYSLDGQSLPVHLSNNGPYSADAASGHYTMVPYVLPSGEVVMRPTWTQGAASAYATPSANARPFTPLAPPATTSPSAPDLPMLPTAPTEQIKRDTRAALPAPSLPTAPAGVVVPPIDSGTLPETPSESPDGASLDAGDALPESTGSVENDDRQEFKRY